MQAEQVIVRGDVWLTRVVLAERLHEVEDEIRPHLRQRLQALRRAVDGEAGDLVPGLAENRRDFLDVGLRRAAAGLRRRDGFVSAVRDDDPHASAGWRGRRGRTVSRGRAE